jgi:hypothetical protein
MNKSITILTLALAAGLLSLTTTAPAHARLNPNIGCILKLDRIVDNAQAAMQAEVDKHADELDARVRRFHMTAQMYKFTRRCLHQFDAEKRNATSDIGSFSEDVSVGTLADDNLAAIERAYQKARKAISLSGCASVSNSAVADLEAVRLAAIAQLKQNIIRSAGQVSRTYNDTKPFLPECVRPL